MKCRSCQSILMPFFSLGKMPAVNHFLTEAELNTEKKYELGLAICTHCHLVQLTHTIPPTDLFSDYIYFSSVSQTILAHAQKTTAYFIDKFSLNENTLVLEVASNDGYFLKNFLHKHIPVLGIDPAKNVAQVAIDLGIPTRVDFFGLRMAKQLKKEGVSPTLIYGANVLAHVETIDDFVQGLTTVLPENGVCIFEFPYIAGLFGGKFDTIYHEHIFYYSLTAVSNVFRHAGLDVYDVELIPMQGGSLRIFAGHIGKHVQTKAYKKLIDHETKLGYLRAETYDSIKEKALTLKRDLHTLLDKLIAQGKTIAAYSAPAKGLVLLNFFHLKKELSFIVDKAPHKQGLYAPGIHLLVEPPSVINTYKPDYLLILCWNIADEILKQEKEYFAHGGKAIIPVPEVKII